MRTKIGFWGLLLLAGSLGMAQQQQDSDACKFNVQGDPAHATVTGLEDIAKLVHVVEQPDSPVEIVSVDLEGMWLSVSGEQHAEQDCARYKVHNRSDRTIGRLRLSRWLEGLAAPGEPEQTVRRHSRRARRPRLRLAAEAAMAERREIT